MSGTKIIGIDLGTTHSCVAVWKDGHVEVIGDLQKSSVETGNLIPSYVHFSSPTACEFGYSARTKADKNLICHAKTLIGRTFRDSDQLKKVFNPDLPCTVILQGESPLFELNFNGHIVHFTPTEISAKILTELKRLAERNLQCEVQGAVITVPASFVDSQRVATKEAGLKAGFSNVELLNEPTAAAIAYGLEANVDGENVLVFDLGAATLDVSLLTVRNRQFHVLATSGTADLGGIYFDREVANYIAEEYRRASGKNLDDDSKSRLLISCSKAIRELDSTPQAIIETLGYRTSLARDKFNLITTRLLAGILPPIKHVLEISSIDKGRVDHIVLIGGSSRIPKVVEIVSGYFNGKTPDLEMVNSSEAVAHGAAVHAAMISGDFLEDEPMIVIMDIASRSLGIETIGGKMNIIIAENTTVPTNQTKMFTTVYDNQTSVMISVYEGEKPETKDNHFLDKFEISGIPARPRGVPQIEVTFELDTSGILSVSASDKSAGKHAKIQITIKN